jgi:hypothetical protein
MMAWLAGCLPPFPCSYLSRYIRNPCEAQMSLAVSYYSPQKFRAFTHRRRGCAKRARSCGGSKWCRWGCRKCGLWSAERAGRCWCRSERAKRCCRWGRRSERRWGTRSAKKRGSRRGRCAESRNTGGTVRRGRWDCAFVALGIIFETKFLHGNTKATIVWPHHEDTALGRDRITFRQANEGPETHDETHLE